jgi:hypothetical protein
MQEPSLHRTRREQPPAKRPHGRPGEADRHSGDAQDSAPSRSPPLHASRLQKFVDLHHIELRSDSGQNEADNLVTLCGAHHRAAHHGKLRVTGSVPAGVRFQHADGSDYGLVARPQVAQLRAKGPRMRKSYYAGRSSRCAGRARRCAPGARSSRARLASVSAGSRLTSAFAGPKAFAALRGLGFRERAVHRVLAEEAHDVDGRDENLESVLRSALARLTDARARR